MARRKSTSTTSSKSLTTLLAFISIVLCAVAWTLAMLFAQLNMNAGLVGWIRTAASIMMSIVVLIVAYNYVRYKGVGMKVLYWICAVVVIALQVIIINEFKIF